MSGFDVSRADTHRTRGLVAAASLTLSAVLLIALMTSNEPQSDASPIDRQTALDTPVADNSQLLAEASQVASSQDVLQPPPMTLAVALDPVELNYSAFTDCVACATTIQVERVVPSGGTLAGLLDDAGIDRVEAARAISALSTVYDLRRLPVGERIRLYVETTPDAEGGDEASAVRLNGLSFRPDVERSITVARTWDDNYRARETHATFERELVRATGEINTSLYVDALNAGATDRVVVELAGVLGYAIDFHRSIQPGDGFDILFERMIDDEGDVARTGDILYARYAGRGEPKEFFRFRADFSRTVRASESSDRRS